jgi:hypothetical protein
MAKQSLLWTALPNGYTDTQTALRVSVLVSPRLDAEAEPQELKTFSHFEKWPETLAQSKFTLHFGPSDQVTIAGNDTTSTSHVDTTLGGPDTSVWNALFPPTTFVRGFAFSDHSKERVLSYPAMKIDELVGTLYSSLAATAGDDLPKVTEILNNPDWGKVISAVAEIDRRFLDQDHKLRDARQQFNRFREDGFNGLESPATELALFQLFHTPPSTEITGKYNFPPPHPKSFAKWRGFEQTKLPAPSDFAKELDFHRIVAAMNQFPTLLRKLGLVVDFIIAKSEFNNAANQALSVTVDLPPLPLGSPVAPAVASMQTRTLLDPKRFLPVPRVTPGAGDYTASDGLLVLSPNRFRLIQIDGDGAGLKVMNFARTLSRMDGQKEKQVDPVTKTEYEEGAPALRNAGMMLVHTDRGAMLKNSFDRQKTQNDLVQQLHGGATVTPPQLFAEDVVRGYRIDIWDSKTKRWRSLCQRTAEYDINASEVLLQVEEEGTLRLGATKSPDPASNQDLVWLHEALVSWTGWSLCARAPGRTIHHDSTSHEDPVGDAEATVPPGLRMKTRFNALLGSLPRLRYGRKYWIRARVVDLAANSLPPNPKDFGPESPSKHAVTYLRYEPISPPSLTLVKPAAAPVEAPAEGESMERLAVRTFNDTTAKNTVTITATARRFAVPSRTNHREAELHGMLDHNGKVDPATFTMLTAKDNSFSQETLLLGGPLAEPVPTIFGVCEEGQALPYLPEPLALEVVARIFGHPNFAASALIPIPLYKPTTSWPDAEPFKIHLYENPADQPHFDEVTRTLFIPLPKAIRATLRLSVRPTRGALELLGPWSWLTTDAQKKRAQRGQHWMLTPWRNVELVHAVQKPLITPTITQIRIDRGKDDKYASPNFTATCSIKSTDHLDLRADWNEPIEDLAEPAGKNRARTDHAFAVKITEPESYGGKPDYLLKGTDLVQSGGNFHDKVASKFHEFNDTRYRRIEYWLEATTKFREFMPATVLTKQVGGETVPTDEKIKVIGEKITAWIPNSAAPPAPRVLYVIPTFGWVRTTEAGKQSSWRRGGGLRVYLDRPWNVSGYGEMLAVVLPSAAAVGDPNTAPARQPLKNFVTQWGNDPIWLSAGVTGATPKQSNFPLARMAPDLNGAWLPAFAPADKKEAEQRPGPFATKAMLHPEIIGAFPESKVDLAPHDVFYDNERQLWYCDIEITWGASYYPFVRLALARYQPVSVTGAHLSPIVLADFMPLVSERWLSVKAGNDPKKRQVSVFGSTYSKSSAHVLETQSVAETSIIEVSVQRFDPALGEDFGWKREVDAVITLDGGKQTPAKPTATQLARAKKLMQERNHAALLKEALIGGVFITPPLWKGSVTLPQAPGGSTRYRLVIAEFEEYLVDDEDPYRPPFTKKDRRLVFIEQVELS